MRSSLFLAAAFLALAGAAVASCPQGSAYADGCAGLVAAGQEGLFKYASYAAYQAAETLSGQTWTAAREPWNKCGVDFGCGAYTARASMRVPGVDTLPTGCAMTTQAGGGPEVLCTDYAGSISLTGWDFHPLSGPYAGQCVYVRTTSTAVTAPGATLTIQDDHFQSDLQCTVLGTTGQLLTIEAPAPGGLLVQSSDFDGNCFLVIDGVQSSLFVDDRANGGGTGTWKFNHIFNACGRPGNVAYNSSLWLNNLIENWCILCSNTIVTCPVLGNGYHGETMELFVGSGQVGAPTDVPSVVFDYNTAASPKTYYAAFTSNVFVAGFSARIDYLEVENNSFIDNTTVSQGATNFAAGLLEVGVNAVTTAVVTGNYVDTTGVVGTAPAKACIVQGAASRGLPGSISGTTLTITGDWTIADGLITPGGILYGGVGQGTAYPIVQAYGAGGTSGVGGPGTYALSVPATSTGPYTETAVVGAWSLGSGGAPSAGGTNNWSLTANSAITGVDIIDGSGAQTCS